ncbi:MAG TPA: hypothetical protein PLD53_07050 [Candidatus Propionivibrio aalborgensis]|nr:hypothetical protein [Candidatus Propionivibrio aalborgensis]
MLSYAACAAEAIRSDVHAIVGQPHQIVIFSSGPKAGRTDVFSSLAGIGALAGALRLARVDIPIVLDVASAADELPQGLPLALPEPLATWVFHRAEIHGADLTNPYRYAYEHASPTMFGDLLASQTSAIRMTVGGATEAPFWAVRMLVRQTALARGYFVAPAAGVILKALKRPWYSATQLEPPLAMMQEPKLAITALDRAANPERGGNVGLCREARALRQFVNNPGLAGFLDAMHSVDTIARFVRASGFVVGPRLAELMGGNK